MTRQMRTVWSCRREILVTLAGLAVATSCMAPGCQLGESPMGFSPEGKTLALVTVEPLVTNAASLPAGAQTFRLMVISNQKQIRVLEERKDMLLTAPGYSPDGKQVVYLRIPLLTESQSKTQSEEVGNRLKPLDSMINKGWAEWWGNGGRPEAPQSQPASTLPGVATTIRQGADTQPAVKVIDAALPPVTGTFSTFVNTLFLPTVTAELVVRDIEAGTVLSETSVELPALDDKTVYMNTRPEFDRAGKWVYFTTGPVVVAVQPITGQTHVLAGNNQSASLSPDGKTLAVWMAADKESEHGVIGLIATDGQTALYRRLPVALYSSPVWVNDHTLALLVEEKGPQGHEQVVTSAASQSQQPSSLLVYRLRTDGKMSEPTHIALPAERRNASIADGITIAPDGKHVVVAGAPVIFATTDGKILSQWQAEQNITLTQPAFSPDSRVVAFKVNKPVSDKVQTTEAVAFFSNEGKMLTRVEIPSLAGSASQPPAGQPAE